MTRGRTRAPTAERRLTAMPGRPAQAGCGLQLLRDVVDGRPAEQLRRIGDDFDFPRIARADLDLPGARDAPVAAAHISVVVKIRG
jgi:hypothetical protein